MNLATKKSLQIREITPNKSMEIAHFFNSSSFLLNKPFKLRGWQLLGSQPLAQIFFYIKGGVAFSGFQATFGSFDVVENIAESELLWFIKSLINELKENGVSKVKIRHFPSHFATANFILKALEQFGFNKVLTETNQHINVNKPNFENVADRSEVIRSNKCEKLGYTFKITSIDDLPVIYKLIENTLLRKGNRPSMSFTDLKKTIEACAENYLLFTLWDKNTLIAATVSVKINSSNLYNFYHSDHLEYRAVSALTYLLKNIYLYCYKHNFQTLDLGISSINGVINKGLFNFKKARGAVISDKNYYNLSL